MKVPISAFGIVLLGLIGCVSPQLIQISPGVYMVSAVDKGGGFGNSAKMKAKVIRMANDYAEQQGKVAIPVTTNETGVGFMHFATFDYQFRLVDKGSQEAAAVNTLGPMPTVSIQKTEQKTESDIHTQDAPPQKDIYVELEKLDSLRKKGIITEAEFDAQKKKILERQ